jgi:hypothetical protein
MEIYAAVTTTDDEGRYSLCRLPQTASYIEIWSDGFQTRYQPVQVSGLLELDIEMKRK